MSSKTIPEISAESRVLIARLSKAAVGEVVTYAELSKIAGRDVRKEAHGSLTTARRRMMRDEKRLFVTIHNVGIKWAADSEIPTVGRHRIKLIHSGARRAIAEQMCLADYESLSKEAQVERNAVLSQAGLLLHMTTAKAEDRILKIANEHAGEIPAAKMLELFKSNGK